jgi:hypothetical protein
MPTRDAGRPRRKSWSEPWLRSLTNCVMHVPARSDCAQPNVDRGVRRGRGTLALGEASLQALRVLRVSDIHASRNLLGERADLSPRMAGVAQSSLRPTFIWSASRKCIVLRATVDVTSMR